VFSSVRGRTGTLSGAAQAGVVNGPARLLAANQVDGAAVNGTARLSRGLGWLGSRLQTGQVGIYVVLFLVGALWVLRAVVR